jgi:hypothetical protein
MDDVMYTKIVECFEESGVTVEVDCIEFYEDEIANEVCKELGDNGCYNIKIEISSIDLHQLISELFTDATRQEVNKMAAKFLTFLRGE